MNSIKHAIFVSALGLLLLNTAQAQTKHSIDFTPHFGVMVPLANVVDAGAISSGSPAAKHNTDLLLGGLLTFWWSPEWAVEFGAMYAPNAIESDAFSVPGEVDAQFLTVSGRLVYDFGQNPARPAFMLTGGLGAFFTDYDSPLSMKTGAMGLVSLALRIPITTKVGVRIDLTDYISTTNWELAGGGETDKLLQNDITIKGGLTFSFGKPVQ